MGLHAWYAAQKTAEQGADYCKRKVMYLKEQLDKIGALIKEKQRILADVSGVLSRKVQQAQQQQALAG
jgi:prefoldin alpha subunit